MSPTKQEVCDSVQLHYSPCPDGGTTLVIEPSPKWCGYIIHAVNSCAKNALRGKTKIPANAEGLAYVKTAICEYLTIMVERNELVEQADGVWYMRGPRANEIGKSP